MKFLKYFLLIFIIASKALAYESASYQVLKPISTRIEIRKYEQMILAEVKSNHHEDDAFRILFKFITGKNEKNQDIKMTTPVFQEVGDGENVMSFVMPAQFKLEDLPKPQDEKIKFRVIKDQKFIAIKFSGFRSEKNYQKYADRLKEAAKENNINADFENPIRATYNPPWTLPFLRRNEVLFKIN